MLKKMLLVSLLIIFSFSLVFAQILTEDFEGGTMPAGWTTLNGTVDWTISSDNSSQYWTIPAHTIYASFNDDGAGSGADNGDVYIATPSLDFSAVTHPLLSFESYAKGSLTFTIRASIAGGDWTDVASIATSTDWVPEEVDLISLAGESDVKIAFHYNDGGTWGYGWCIDDIVIGAAPAISDIAGTVTDGVDPIEGAVVTVGTISDTTGADGTYLISDLFVGNYDVVCMAAGYFGATQNVDVIADETATVDFALDPLVGDTTADAIEATLVGNAFTYSGENAAYYNDYPFGNGVDLVFHLTLAEDAIVDADLLGSDYDTKLAIYNDTEEPGVDNELYGNDDYTAPGRNIDANEKRNSRSRALQSAIFGMELPAGGYWVLVDSYSITSSYGAYVLNIVVDGGTDPLPAVFFSEYIEGSSNNKALEIYNGTDAEIDLADFVVRGNYNGNAWSEAYPFEVGTMLAAGDVYVMASVDADQPILDVADVTFAYGDPWYMTAFNGDDVRALCYVVDTDTTIIDIIGRYDLVDPGAGWPVAGIDDGTKEHTLVRKDAVAMGNADWDASAGTNADDSEWIVLEQDDFAYIGWHMDQPMTPAYISGMVTIDGFGDLTMATVAAGDSMTYVNADGTYMLEVLAGTYDVTASLGGYTDATVAGVVVTEGATTENVDFALMVIEETLWPPVNLDYTISGNEVNLSWTAPSQYGWNSYYQGPASLTWAAPERATLYDVTDFGFSYPMELSAITHGFYHHSSYPWGEDTTFSFKIYDADGSTVLYESAVLTALEQWNDTLLELETPITVTDNFWVSVAVTNTETGFPSSLFSGATTGLHGYVGSPGDWGVAEYDWATEIYIMGETGTQALSYNNLVQKEVTTPISRTEKRFDSVRIDEIAPNSEIRDLVSFNIYRDGVMINADPVTGTTYVDTELAAGTYTYYATAVWNYGESGASNEVTAVLAYGDISGTVTNPDGDPIEGAAVTAGVYGATTGADGTYLIEDLLIGTYDVACSAPVHEVADAVSATVTENGNTVVDFVLIPSEGDLFFLDDFEAGIDNWTVEGTWGLTEEGANSPTHSLTESPDANYTPDINISATLANPWDLSGVFGATLSFWYQSDIETAFDYMYLEITADGENWINLATYDEEDGAWQQETISISGFVGPGFDTVSIRFRFESDGGYETVGMLIDDVQVTTSSEDMDPPFIIHAGPEFYEGTDEDYMFTAELVDPSTVASAQVVYTVDGGDELTADATQGDGNTWNFTIPAQAAGAQVDYKIVATDASTDSNSGELGGFVYIAGYHFIYDNGIVDFYTVINEGISAAVKVVNPAGTLVDLAYALIRNYTDVSGQDNDNFMFHVWADDGGLPGADMITPFEVVPEATPQNTSPMTRIDLRDYAAELAAIDTDFFIGLSVETGDPEGKVHCTISQPANWNQSYGLLDGIWSQVLDTDYHFRAVAALAETEFATINGNVTFDGAPVEGATIVAGTYSADTDAAGDYELFVNPGTYTVTISAEGFEDFMEEVTVADGDVATVDAVLIPAFWAPVNLSYTLNGTNAVLQWDAPEAPAPGEDFFEDFEGTFPPTGWTKLSPDGGTGWDQIAVGTTPLPGWTGGDAIGAPDGGDYMAYATYTTGGASSNDQWLVTPMIDVSAGSVLSFNMVCWYASSYADHVEILISTTNNTDIAAFDTEVAIIELDAVDDEEWAVYNYNLTDFVSAGSQVYIAFRENVADNLGEGAFVAIDNFSVGAAAAMPAGFVSNRPATGRKDEAYVATPLAPTYNHATRSLAGYKIYKDDVEIGTTNASTTFFVATGITTACEIYVTATYTDPDGESGASNVVFIDPGNAPGDIVPMVTALNGNYPNPFNPSTKISFSLKEAGNVSIDIFNIKGQKVKTLVNEKMEAAHYNFTWNGTDDSDKSVSSGIYFYRMNTKDYKATKKMMLLK